MRSAVLLSGALVMAMDHKSESQSTGGTPVSAYASPMRCAVLTQRMVLHPRYAVSGTDAAYGATSGPVPRQGGHVVHGSVAPLSAYAILRDVRY
eukprot:1282267-Rhodomonas_salina.1